MNWKWVFWIPIVGYVPSVVRVFLLGRKVDRETDKAVYDFVPVYAALDILKRARFVMRFQGFCVIVTALVVYFWYRSMHPL